MNIPNLEKFPAFPSIPRLLRDVVITEKIDGTNALIHVDEDYNVFAGSRSRWITPEDDNFGFARWVQENAEILKNLGIGTHAGEWWGKGIQRRYNEAQKNFSLFNVGVWQSEFNSGTSSSTVCVQVPCCHVVPKLFEGTMSDSAVFSSLDRLKTNGSYASKGFMNPEGIVLYHTKSQQLYKVTLDHNDANKFSINQ